MLEQLNEEMRNKLVKIQVPIQIYTLLLMASSLDTDEEMKSRDELDGEESRTELDSHANMPVVGRHSFL